MLPRPVWGEKGFSDTLEAELFNQYLSEIYLNRDINVYVLHGGNNGYTYDIRDGVKYIGISGTETDFEGLSIFDHFSYIKFYIDREGNTSYQVLPLFKER